jgi:hypothetical protein
MLPYVRFLEAVSEKDAECRKFTGGRKMTWETDLNGSEGSRMGRGIICTEM